MTSFDDSDPSRPARRGRSPVEWFRVGLGLIWTLNLVFILDPANQFFPTFADTASSFAGTSASGPGLAEFVAANPMVFSLLIAGTTVYLAIAFLAGLTTRLACVTGAAFNSILLLTQFGQVVVLGGTDVGPMPLYLVLYLGLFVGAAGSDFALDARIWRSGLLRTGALFRWIGSPRPLSAVVRRTGSPRVPPRSEPSLPA